LPQQFFLNASQLFRRLHRHLHNQVAATMFVQVRNAFAAQTNFLPALRALGNLHWRFTFQRRNIDLRAQRRLRKRNRDLAMQVVSIARKKLVRLHRKHNVQVA
jgi:hypothetical protein